MIEERINESKLLELSPALGALPIEAEVGKLLRQFGEEVKDACMNAVDEAIAKDDTDTTKIINAIRQNVIIK